MIDNAKKWLEQNYDNMISDLKQLISCKSVQQEAQEGMPFGKGCYDALKCVENIAKKFGFKFVNMDGYIGYFDYENTENVPEVGILCHVDVVPAVNFVGDPFTLRRENGKMIARGIIDDKGPAIIMLYCLKALKESGFAPSKNIRMMFGCNEESGWEDIAYYKAHNTMPKMGYSPDADYPLINAEKGIITLKVEKELISQKIISIVGGNAANMVPDKCDCIINLNKDTITTILHKSNIIPIYSESENGLVSSFFGKAAHASTPKDGDNAIINAIESLRKIDSAFSELNYLFSDNSGKGLGFYEKDVTLNLGKIEYSENKLCMLVDIRYPKTLDFETVDRQIKKSLNGYDLKYIHHMPCSGVDENHELCQKLLLAYEMETGIKGKPFTIGGGTYSRAFDKGVAFGCVFPDEPMMAHKANEYMLEDNFKLNCNIQLQGIYQLCK